MGIIRHTLSFVLRGLADQLEPPLVVLYNPAKHGCPPVGVTFAIALRDQYVGAELVQGAVSAAFVAIVDTYLRRHEGEGL